MGNLSGKEPTSAWELNRGNRMEEVRDIIVAGLLLFVAGMLVRSAFDMLSQSRKRRKKT